MNLKSIFKVRLPKPTGSFPVGFVDREGGNQTNPIIYRVFYPAAALASDDIKKSSCPWMPSLSQADQDRPLIRLGNRLCSKILQGVHLHAQRDAPLASTNRPLVIFSHGLASNRSTFSTLLSQLASMGYIAAATQHSLFGSSWSYDMGIFNLERRINEVRLILQEFQSKKEFSIDQNRIYLMGHSFGGATVLQSILSEGFDGIGKVVALDPWMYPVALCRNVTRTDCLIINSAKFNWSGNYRAIQEYLRHIGGGTILDLYESGHGSLTDYPYFFRPGSISSLAYHSDLILQVAKLIDQYITSGSLPKDVTSQLGSVTNY